MIRYARLFRSSSADICIRLLASVVFLNAATVRGQDSVPLRQAFRDLTNDAVIMNLSAHPDDEDGSTLAYYRMKYGVKTYSIFFTRGEGGQNEIGPELYEELGVIRTRETLEAAQVLGTEARFLNFTDFGFSKTATEAFKKWGGQQEVVRRLVYVIRKYKPDVIFTNHSTIGGHGQHQAVAVAALAAFDAAADSTMFPEQLRLPGITLWQPRKLYFRTLSRLDPTADVVNQIGELDPDRNVSYLDIASEALAHHKTQGMTGADLRRFTRGLSVYKLMRSNSIYTRDTTTFLGGIALWNDPSLRPLHDLRRLLATLSPGISRDSLLSLVERIQQTDVVLQAPVAQRIWLHWQEELENLVAQSCGISVSWTFADRVVVPTQKVHSTVRLDAKDCTLADLRCSFDLPQGWAANGEPVHSAALKGRTLERAFEVFVGDYATMTLPKVAAIYNPIETEQQCAVHARVLVNGKRVSLSARPAFDVAPFQTLAVTPKICRLASTQRGKGKTFHFAVKNFAPRKAAGRIVVQVPPGWMAESGTYVIPSEDSTATGTLFVKAPDDVQPGNYTLRFKTDYAKEDVIVRVFDVNVAADIRLGIIKSYDTTLEAAAAELGVPYTLLDANALEGNLSPFHSIVVDIRGYFARDDVKKNSRRLLDYVRNGGNLIVMYQKDQDWKPEFAPYPMDVTRNRVADEDAPITILQPHHPLFRFPNSITESAWDGWIQERGVYFPDNVAPEYTHLLSSNDPDEPPLTTGYLVAEYGKGSYIYTSYVWYRQLKEYNPGAFRCFANMIAYPRYRSQQ